MKNFTPLRIGNWEKIENICSIHYYTYLDQIPILSSVWEMRKIRIFFSLGFSKDVELVDRY